MEVTNPELDALEDVLTVWLLCDRHKVRSMKATQAQIAGWQHGCKTCHAIYQKEIQRALRLWSKLVQQYDKSPSTNARRSTTAREGLRSNPFGRES